MKKIYFVKVDKITLDGKWYIWDENGKLYTQSFWSEKEAKEMMELLNSIPAPKDI